jgi:hypothetical protein
LGLAQSYAEGSKEFIGEYLERFHGPGAAGAAKALKGIANKLGTHDVVSGFKITPDDIIILDHATFADVNAVLATQGNAEPTW